MIFILKLNNFAPQNVELAIYFESTILYFNCLCQKFVYLETSGRLGLSPPSDFFNIAFREALKSSMDVFLLYALIALIVVKTVANKTNIMDAVGLVTLSFLILFR